jgi:predicted glutamine amidotransferase
MKAGGRFPPDQRRPSLYDMPAARRSMPAGSCLRDCFAGENSNYRRVAESHAGGAPMCRWIAYRGQSIPLERYVTAPAHSLLVQSLRALESAASTNGDGFGLGWYGDHEEPGLYHEVRPAWSDENLRHLCRHIHSHLFFAHVRASTGTPTTRPNCHPFGHSRWMFMHNGQIGDWSLIRRQVEALIPDALYGARIGTTDSEAVFLAILGAGCETDPISATSRTLATLTEMVRLSGTTDPLRFTAALSNGRDLFAFRYANTESANTLYYRDIGDSVLIVSEPLDMERAYWKPVPASHAIIARAGEKVILEPFLATALRAAE